MTPRCILICRLVPLVTEVSRSEIRMWKIDYINISERECWKTDRQTNRQTNRHTDKQTWHDIQVFWRRSNSNRQHDVIFILVWCGCLVILSFKIQMLPQMRFDSSALKAEIVNIFLLQVTQLHFVLKLLEVADYSGTPCWSGLSDCSKEVTGIC